MCEVCDSQDLLCKVEPATYDSRHINWSRLLERVIAGLINTVVYGTVIVLAKLSGLF